MTFKLHCISFSSVKTDCDKVIKVSSSILKEIKPSLVEICIQRCIIREKKIKIIFIIIWRDFDFFFPPKEDGYGNEAISSSYSVSSFENQTQQEMEIRSRVTKFSINILNPSIRSHNQTVLPVALKEPPTGC